MQFGLHIIFLVLVLLFEFFILSHSASYIDEDTIVIEAAEPGASKRVKRQTIMMYPYPMPQYGYPQQTYLQSQQPYAPSTNSHTQCRTNTGVAGQCMTLKQCYPNIYIQNYDVSSLLLRNLTLCQPASPNFLFSAHGNAVCCPNRYGRKIEGQSMSPEKQRLWNAIPLHLRKMVPPNVSPVPIQKYPWTVAIMNGAHHHCGGSLINRFTVLTAAHCLYTFDSVGVSNLRVLLGHHDISHNEQSHAVTRKVIKSIFHKDFSMKTLYNDIGILILDYSVPMNENLNISPVKLSRETPLAGKAMIAGWGQMGWNLPATPNLMETTIDIWSNRKCSAMYGRLAPGGITNTMICGSAVGKDACRGDSGSPLMYTNKNGQTEQIGIVSWGIECGRYPSVHTRLTSFINWIQKNRLD